MSRCTRTKPGVSPAQPGSGSGPLPAGWSRTRRRRRRRRRRSRCGGATEQRESVPDEPHVTSQAQARELTSFRSQRATQRVRGKRGPRRGGPGHTPVPLGTRRRGAFHEKPRRQGAYLEYLARDPGLDEGRRYHAQLTKCTSTHRYTQRPTRTETTHAHAYTHGERRHGYRGRKV